MVLGVCGGLGEYFGLDPVLVRLAFVLITFAGGAGVLAYVVLAIVLPNDDVISSGSSAQLRHEGESTDAGDLAGTSDPTRGLDSTAAIGAARRHRNRQAAGFFLITLGVAFVAANLGWLSWIHWSVLWPIVLIALGVAILLKRTN